MTKGGTMTVAARMIGRGAAALVAGASAVKATPTSAVRTAVEVRAASLGT